MKESPTEKENKEPFKEALIPKPEFSPNIKSLKSRSDKLIRHWRVSADDVYSLNKKEREKILEKNVAEFKEGVRDIRELSERYGIALPTFEFVLGDRGGDKINIFTVIDKIDGESLQNVEKFPQEAKDKLDNFYKSMAQYYFDKYKEGGNYFWDFRNSQFIYGHKKGEKEDRVYMVDIEPRSDKHGEQDHSFDILMRAGFVLTEALDAAKRFEKGAKFDKTINTFKQNLNEISSKDDKIEKCIEFLKNKLKEYEDGK